MNASKEHCPANETLAAYVDRRLNPSERDRVEAHLSGCAACRGEVLALARLLADVAASNLVPSPRLRSAVMAKVHSRKPSTARSAPWRQGWGFTAASVAAAAALLAVGLGLWTGRPTPRPAEGERLTSTPPKPAPEPPRPAPAPKPEPPKLPDAPEPPKPAPAAPAPAPDPAPKPPEKPKTEPVAPPPPATPKPAEPPRAEPPEAPRPEPTRTVLATLQRAEGQVFLVQGNERRPAAVSAELLSGHGITTGPAGASAVVRYPDGTAVELGPDTRVARIFEDEGKRLDLAQGSLRATVVKQPAGRPFAVLTPHGEARVVGTTFRLTVRPGERGLTRVDVTEGKVQLKGAGKTVDVPVGHFGVAAAGAEPAARPVTSLLAHWKLDDAAGSKTAADASGNGNDAPLQGQADWCPGRIGGGLNCAKGGFGIASLDVAGSYAGNAATVALWVYQDNLHTWQDGYVHFAGLSMIREGNMDPGRIRVTWKTEGENENLGADATVRSKQWVHVAVAWDGTTARLYRNGRLAATSKVKGPFQPAGGAQIRVGADPNAKVDFELRVDDLQLYRRALMPQEIQQVMAGAAVR